MAQHYPEFFYVSTKDNFYLCGLKLLSATVYFGGREILIGSYRSRLTIVAAVNCNILRSVLDFNCIVVVSVLAGRRRSFEVFKTKEVP